jgi:hypothetical protein
VSRSNKEAREHNLGTGGLENARKGLAGRRKAIDEAVDGPYVAPKKKKKVPGNGEDTE